MNEATKNSVRSGLTAGVAVMTAATIAFVPSVAQPAAHPTATPTATVRVVSPPIQLTAAVQPLSAAAVPNLLADWLENIVVPPSAGAPVPTPPSAPVAVGNGIDSAIKNVYDAVEPWVRYGFELATYAVGWVPFVGWLAPQIMIFYNLGERIVRSITFNVADWIGGNISFGQGLVNVGRATIDSFVRFGYDEFHFFLPNIPLPPLPPIGNVAGLAVEKVDPGPAKGLDVVVAPAGAEAGTPTGTDVPVDQTQEPKTINRPFRGGGLTKLIQTFTGRDVPGGTTSVSVQTLGEEQTVGENGTGDQSAAGDQARPRPHGLIGSVSSAVRDLVASVPHPLRDRAVAAKPVKASAGDPE